MKRFFATERIPLNVFLQDMNSFLGKIKAIWDGFKWKVGGKKGGQLKEEKILNQSMPDYGTACFCLRIGNPHFYDQMSKIANFCEKGKSCLAERILWEVKRDFGVALIEDEHKKFWVLDDLWNPLSIPGVVNIPWSNTAVTTVANHLSFSKDLVLNGFDLMLINPDKKTAVIRDICEVRKTQSRKQINSIDQLKGLPVAYILSLSGADALQLAVSTKFSIRCFDEKQNSALNGGIFLVLLNRQKTLNGIKIWLEPFVVMRNQFITERKLCLGGLTANEIDSLFECKALLRKNPAIDKLPDYFYPTKHSPIQIFYRDLDWWVTFVNSQNKGLGCVSKLQQKNGNVDIGDSLGFDYGSIWVRIKRLRPIADPAGFFGHYGNKERIELETKIEEQLNALLSRGGVVDI